eukprot:TRINITY_DN38153_c2_g1_i1.p1 TRINITY_DN38153_c2_g1~~TRINITY_DN38153_c2_g1_i1.p1  ORF type:complete len:124 (+),score=8.18 TRINITY_DN38153_c2_g1_i1:460-831(+)
MAIHRLERSTCFPLFILFYFILGWASLWGFIHFSFLASVFLGLAPSLVLRPTRSSNRAGATSKFIVFFFEIYSYKKNIFFSHTYKQFAESQIMPPVIEMNTHIYVKQMKTNNELNSAWETTCI